VTPPNIVGRANSQCLVKYFRYRFHSVICSGHPTYPAVADQPLSPEQLKMEL